MVTFNRIDAALRPMALLGAASAVMGWAGIAMATPSCKGTYAATLLQPLPAPIVIGLDLSDPSPSNIRLGQRFLDGMRSVGVKVGPPSTVTLHVTVSWLGGGPASYGGGGGGQEDTYSDVGGLDGGVSRLLPTPPSRNLLASQTPPSPPLLFLRVDATEGQETRIAWVASVQCQVTGSDDGQLAEELGGVIGQAVGQRIERRRL
jgi:hypothetical protein